MGLGVVYAALYLVAFFFFITNTTSFKKDPKRRKAFYLLCVFLLGWAPAALVLVRESHASSLPFLETGSSVAGSHTLLSPVSGGWFLVWHGSDFYLRGCVSRRWSLNPGFGAHDRVISSSNHEATWTWDWLIPVRCIGCCAANYRPRNFI